MSLSPHEYTADSRHWPSLAGCAPAVSFHDFSRRLGRRGWPAPPAPVPAPSLRALADKACVVGAGAFAFRDGPSVAVLSATSITLRVCGVARFALANALCVFPCAPGAPAVSIALPQSPCHPLIGPMHALASVVLETGATNVFYRRRQHPAGDVDMCLRLDGQWLCAGCSGTFVTEAAYRAHVGAPGADGGPVQSLLPVEYTRPAKPFETFDHGTVASDSRFNSELHGRLRLQLLCAARQAGAPCH